MKKILLTGIALAAAFLQPGMAQERTASTQLSPLLSLYYNIKDALISGNSVAAAASAEAYVEAAAKVDMASMPATAHEAYMPLSEKLLTDAKAMSGTKDINKQREYFKTFSDNFYTLAKAVSISAQPVYQEYCPMKKAYWLSSSTAIKNPYYGNQMLTCGKVSDTIK
ncbi:DUF3347 domain-containing protein [Chitinophaga sp. 22321]|uniref:DUF3347 domain-containing protein n=1 Tax=Chitinophaga hostae TaxID=2831022 RepID=A0ABS5J9X8_9BACT|nr:DUF3347 domain-containing protein [Chitinophaga hostae]MBS0032009.1 DUF3347 domain-containing protein [Chitinophaga hostae]